MFFITTISKSPFLNQFSSINAISETSEELRPGNYQSKARFDFDLSIIAKILEIRAIKRINSADANPSRSR